MVRERFRVARLDSRTLALGVSAVVLMSCAHVHTAERRVLFRAQQDVLAGPEAFFERLSSRVRIAGYEPTREDLLRGEIAVTSTRYRPRRGTPPELLVVAHLDGTVEVTAAPELWVSRRGRAPRLPRALEEEAVSLAIVLMEGLGAEGTSYPIAEYQSAGRRR